MSCITQIQKSVHFSSDVYCFKRFNSAWESMRSKKYGPASPVDEVNTGYQIHSPTAHTFFRADSCIN